MPLIMELVSGAVDGNLIGASSKRLSIGFLENTVAGLVAAALMVNF